MVGDNKEQTQISDLDLSQAEVPELDSHDDLLAEAPEKTLTEKIQSFDKAIKELDSLIENLHNTELYTVDGLIGLGASVSNQYDGIVNDSEFTSLTEEEVNDLGEKRELYTHIGVILSELARDNYFVHQKVADLPENDRNAAVVLKQEFLDKMAEMAEKGMGIGAPGFAYKKVFEGGIKELDERLAQGRSSAFDPAAEEYRKQFEEDLDNIFEQLGVLSDANFTEKEINDINQQVRAAIEEAKQQGIAPKKALGILTQLKLDFSKKDISGSKGESINQTFLKDYPDVDELITYRFGRHEVNSAQPIPSVFDAIVKYVEEEYYQKEQHLTKKEDIQALAKEVSSTLQEGADILEAGYDGTSIQDYISQAIEIIKKSEKQALENVKQFTPSDTMLSPEKDPENPIDDILAKIDTGAEAEEDILDVLEQATAGKPVEQSGQTLFDHSIEDDKEVSDSDVLSPNDPTVILPGSGWQEVKGVKKAHAVDKSTEKTTVKGLFDIVARKEVKDESYTTILHPYDRRYNVASSHEGQHKWLEGRISEINSLFSEQGIDAKATVTAYGNPLRRAIPAIQISSSKESEAQEAAAVVSNFANALITNNKIDQDISEVQVGRIKHDRAIKLTGNYLDLHASRLANMFSGEVIKKGVITFKEEFKLNQALSYLHNQDVNLSERIRKDYHLNPIVEARVGHMEKSNQKAIRLVGDDIASQAESIAATFGGEVIKEGVIAFNNGDEKKALEHLYKNGVKLPANKIKEYGLGPKKDHISKVEKSKAEKQNAPKGHVQRIEEEKQENKKGGWFSKIFSR